MRKRIAAGLAALAAGLVVRWAGRPRPSPRRTRTRTRSTKATDKGPAPKFLYGHDLRVRPGGKTDFADAARIGVEVFQDETTKAIVAISEAGELAVIPAGAGRGRTRRASG